MTDQPTNHSRGPDDPSLTKSGILPVLNSQTAAACRTKGNCVTRRTMLTGASALALTVLGSGSGSGSKVCAADRLGDKRAAVRARRGSFDTPLKTQGANDYHNSLSRFGGRLSSPTRKLFATAQREHELHFGVVVIGSGYGASITAARLSQHLRSNLRICVLERGKEWVPGTFPDSLSDVLSQTTSNLAGPTQGQKTQPLGLFDVTMNDQVNILSGNGLGGGSLINASICLRPHPDVFQQEEWPLALREVETLGPHYDRVATGLGLSATPFDQVPKIRSRRMAAERMQHSADFFDLPPVSVTYDYRPLDRQLRNRQGMTQRPCTLCGDCITGCNIGAKNTLAMNYLPVARHNGTEMYTQMEVKKIEKHQGYYRILIDYIDDSENEITRHPLAINAKLVVLGAGSPHSAGILLESQNERFTFSPALGEYWSGNGDALGFVTGLPPGNNIGGHGAYPHCGPPVGATVQTSLNYYRNVEFNRRLLIQEAAIPRGVSNLFHLLLRDRELDQSMVMLAMGHDGHRGRIAKKDGRYQVIWEGMKEIPYRKMVFQEFEKLALAHGGNYKRLKLFGDNLVTVHPLGGCRMSDNPACGTVNHLGQVYDFMPDRCGDGSAFPSVHQGLYVVDGSIMPTSLGVNPFMTISALSDRIAHHIVHNPSHQDLFEVF